MQLPWGRPQASLHTCYVPHTLQSLVFLCLEKHRDSLYLWNWVLSPFYRRGDTGTESSYNLASKIQGISTQICLTSQFILLSSLHCTLVIRKGFSWDFGTEEAAQAIRDYCRHHSRPLCCPWPWAWFAGRWKGHAAGLLPKPGSLEVPRSSGQAETWVFQRCVF